MQNFFKQISKSLLDLPNMAITRNPAKRAALGEKGGRWVLLQWAKEKVLRAFEANLGNMLEF